MISTVVVDTSYLITLVDPNRTHHKAARRYYEECIRRKTILFLPTIVVSEFHVRQAVTDLELRNFIVLPFNMDDAMTCGELARALPREEGDDRVRVKDDLKIIAQAVVNDVQHVFTEDACTLSKYLDRLRVSDPSAPRAILMKDSYDESWFNHGQTVLPLG